MALSVRLTVCLGLRQNIRQLTVGALINWIGFWGSLYSNYNQDPPPKKKTKDSLGNYKGPYITGDVKLRTSNAARALVANLHWSTSPDLRTSRSSRIPMRL